MREPRQRRKKSRITLHVLLAQHRKHRLFDPPPHLFFPVIDTVISTKNASIGSEITALALIYYTKTVALLMKESELCLCKLFMSRMVKYKIFPAWGVFWLAGATAVRADVASTNAAASDAAATNTGLSALSSLSIEQLMDIKVSILGPSESVSQTPAAVSVATQDDIKRSGARNIPEALRLVPRLDVAQIDSSEWAVSAPG